MLTEEFDVSRTPVMDALKKLSQEELVTEKSGRGYYVVRLTHQKLNEIYDLRKMFETHALNRAIEKIPRNKLLVLKEGMENIRGETNEKEKFIQFMKKDWILHASIIENSHNETLKRFYGQIYDLVRISQNLYRATEQGLKEHMAIVEALLEESFPRAKRALETHLDNSHQRALKALKNTFSPQKQNLT